jgi:hypothetical protein
MKTPLVIICVCFILLSAAVCQNVPELFGSVLMNRGLDFRQGGLVPAEKVRSPLFDYNFNNNGTYKPPGRPDLTFRVPKDIVVRSQQEHVKLEISDIFYSYDHIVKVDMHGSYFSININVGVFGFGFGYSREYGKIYERINSKFIGNIRSLYRTSLYRTLAPPHPLLNVNSMTKQVLEMLPVHPKPEDLQKFAVFFEYYGGWFMTEGVFGGQIRLFQSAHETLLVTRDQNWLKSQFTLSFSFYLFGISGGMHRERSEIKIDEYFKRHSAVEMVYTGGQRKFQNGDQLKQWDRSIDDEQGVLMGKYRPISDLILNSPVKQQNLMWMIRKYSTEGKVEIPPSSLPNKHNGKQKIYGYSLIGAGYDSTYMQPKDYVFLIQQEDSPSPAEAQSLWQQKFAVPLGIAVISHSSSSGVPSSSTLFQHEEVSKTASEYAEQHCRQLTGDFHEGCAKRTRESLTFPATGDRKTMTTEVPLYELRSSLDQQNGAADGVTFKLNPLFEQMVEELPVDGLDDEKYHRAIDIYGTHVIVGVKMGALEKTIMDTVASDKQKIDVSPMMQNRRTIRIGAGGELHARMNRKLTFADAANEPEAIGFKLMSLVFLIKNDLKKKLMQKALDVYFK